ncbi:MAG: TonB-dependent receptor [Bacteroides sp.]|nr:TonB-dependent receptor [Bacteroides sp.]
MHIRIIPVVCMLCLMPALSAQPQDSLKRVDLEEVVVSDAYRLPVTLRSTLLAEVVGKEWLTSHFTGNLVQTLQHIPGVHAMNIGSGFSKPMIRGMGFNRIAVVENGIKQEGQQWGADHGLETDAFNAERVTVIKGPSSLLYGSDAMGGVIELGRVPTPVEPGLSGEAALLGKTVNGTAGASVMLGWKQGRWYLRGRLSAQSYGDYRVPTDTVVYLTRPMPVYGRLKNTAGRETNANLFAEYRYRRYFSSYAWSNSSQKAGFFPGAHGIPDLSRLEDDGNHRNIELPYSRVNHMKVSTRQQYIRERTTWIWDAGFQRNDREEWSAFHTHYGTQSPPERDPDKELAFTLDTYSSALKMKIPGEGKWEHTTGWDLQVQYNRVGGYSFLLPAYRRLTTGWLWLTTWRPVSTLTVSGGLRYDRGRIRVKSYEDPYLKEYLTEMGYSDTEIDAYRWRSYETDRSFGELSGSLGVVWKPARAHQISLNLGRSFRLPGAHELASNGVHHGTFRHEQGDPALDSEQGWQLDLAYSYQRKGVILSLSPFASWYRNYIYLRPSGEWSVLPHAGQVYYYTGARAFFTGAEISAEFRFSCGWDYRVAGEYVYACNRNEHIALPFSPPATLRQTLGWQRERVRVYLEMENISQQNRTDRNEEETAGATLFHMGASAWFRIGTVRPEVRLTAQNLFDRRYYNHLSFYQKVEIPEPGRNFQFVLRLPF